MSKKDLSFEIGDWKFELTGEYPILDKVYHNDKEIRVHHVTIDFKYRQPTRLIIDEIIFHIGEDE